MNKERSRLGMAGLVVVVVLGVLLAGGLVDDAAAQTRPEGEMRW